MPDHLSWSESQTHQDWVCVSHTGKHMKILSKLCQKLGKLVNLSYVHMDLDLKLAVSGDPNLECIRKYQYQSSLSISLYLNINTRMNPSPTGIGYL